MLSNANYIIVMNFSKEKLKKSNFQLLADYLSNPKEFLQARIFTSLILKNYKFFI